MKGSLPCLSYRDIYRATSTVVKGYHAQQGELQELTYNEHHQDIKESSSIPGPKPLPILGNIWRYLPIIGEFDPSRQHLNYEKMYKRYGSVVREVVVGRRIAIHLFDPQDMEAMYRQDGKYPNRLSHQALMKYRLERPEIYNGGGLFPSNGEEWHRLRQTFQKALLHSQIINEYVSFLEKVTEDIIQKIKNFKDSEGEMKDFQKDLYKWAIECTGVIVLNRRLGCIGKGAGSEEEVEALVKAAQDTHHAVMITENGLPLWKLYPTATYRSLVAAQDMMAQIIAKYLKTNDNNTKDDNERIPILDRFLASPNINKKDVFGMALDMFLAGIDTTAYSAAFILYHLAKNQNCQKKLRKELENVFPSKTSEITINSLNSLSYLKACVKESMRLNPLSLGTGRVLQKDLIVSNYRLPAESIVVAQHQVACRQSQYFPDPLTYRPERWLRNALTNRAHPFLVLPFGYGPRMCIGRRFAEVELYLILSKIFRNFHIYYEHEDMDCFTRLINVPDRPLRLKFVDIS